MIYQHFKSRNSTLFCLLIYISIMSSPKEPCSQAVTNTDLHKTRQQLTETVNTLHEYQRKQLYLQQVKTKKIRQNTPLCFEDECNQDALARRALSREQFKNYMRLQLVISQKDLSQASQWIADIEKQISSLKVDNYLNTGYVMPAHMTPISPRS